MPLPRVKPQPLVEANAETRASRLSAVLWHTAQLRRSAHDCSTCKTAEAAPGGRTNQINTNRLPSRQPELLNFKGGRFSSSTNNISCKPIRFRGSSSCHPAIFRLTKITSLRGR